MELRLDPDRTSLLSGLDGKHLTVFGALDRYLPGIPGVSPANSGAASSVLRPWLSRGATA